ncbi:MAG: single-stranded-DNA-specific exonuclease RecJ [Anaerolineae bacterium]|nr:single-stranded-DNA-specific exonuclease RecJ [Thermoflexales bacterium]MDW8053732.1 single-stranded-DNA-specific exonuclease RecJ [Anaerolineae bacterium]
MLTEWLVASPAPRAFFEALPDVHPLTAQVLYARGYRDPEAVRAFLDPPEPAAVRLTDLDRAVARLLRAIRQRERIAIYGDYDCDGVSAAALMSETLAALGADVRVHIPHRLEEGYGLNVEAIERLHAEGASVIVSVDCGARAFVEAERARALGVDLIITDHHALVDGQAPRAFAMVNPQRSEDAAFAELAGVGVAFQLAMRLLAEGEALGLLRDACTSEALLDLVAVGTVADVVPLTGVNRSLVRAGLQRLNTAPRLGLAALVSAARLPMGAVHAGHVGFALAPRLNAAGRLDTALHAYALLVAREPELASQLAQQLDAQNAERQRITDHVSRAAELQALAEDASPPLLFAASSEFNPGVIGLAAQRLVERHHVPAVVVHVDGDRARGSCRSVEGFHITQALDHMRELFEKHGGHAAAAGFTLPASRLPMLRQQLYALAAAARPAGGWKRVLRAEAAIDLSALVQLVDVDGKAMHDLQRLEPHGAGNPRPLLLLHNAVVQRVRRLGAGGEGGALHLHLQLRDRRRVIWDAVGWRLGHRADELREGAAVQLMAHIGITTWDGVRRLQVEVVDFRLS